MDPALLDVLDIPVKEDLLDLPEKMELREHRELRVILVHQERMEIRETKESRETLDLKDSLESKEKRESQVLMVIRETKDQMEIASLTTTPLVTATLTSSLSTLRPPSNQNVQLTLNLYGPDSLSYSSKAMATDFPKILEVLALASRSSSLCLSCSAQALMCADTVSELTNLSGWQSTPRLTILSSP